MRPFTKTILASASIAAFSAPAYAQDPASEEGLAAESNEIVVTARRRDESLQDVPLSIQAVTGQELQKLEIRQFEDVTRAVPGLQLFKTGVSSVATLRGVSFDTRASGAANSVEFYRNDAVITGTALFQAVYDIGQVEVLRGPQGTLRGRASPSGSITITTRRPDLLDPGGYVSGSVGENSRWNFNAAVNVPIIADKLGIRVAGFVGQNRANNVFGLDVPANAIDRDVYERTRAIRASVRADPFDGILTLDFSYEAIANNSRQYSQVQSLSEFLPASELAGRFNGGASTRTITAGDRLGVGADANSFDRNFKLYNWQAALRQFGQRLTYVGSKTVARQVNFESPSPQGLLTSFDAPSSTPVRLADGSTVFIDAPGSRFLGYTGNNLDQVTHEVRLQNEDRIAGMFDYVVGAFQITSDGPTQLFTPAPTGVSPVAGTPFYDLTSFRFGPTYRFRNDKEESLFGNVTVHLGDSTEISGGLRHIWFKANSGAISGTDEIGAEIRALRRCIGGTDPGCEPTKEATIYSASIKHSFTPDMMAYFSFGTSWRPGNVFIGYGLRERAIQGASLDPFTRMPDETSKSFEVGIKTTMFDRLNFNLSAFYQTFDNYPLLVPDVRTIAQTTSGGTTAVGAFTFGAPANVEVKGFEAELAYEVSPNFDVAATVAFADSRAKDVVIPCAPAGLPPVGDPGYVAAYQAAVGAGNQVGTCSFTGSASNQPRWSGTVQAEYSQPTGFGDAFLRGFMNWKGDSGGNATNPFDQVEAYALVDLFAGVRDPGGAWELSAFVKNLFDTTRVLTRSSSWTESIPGNVGATNNYAAITTTDPREFGVSLRYAFGSR